MRAWRSASPRAGWSRAARVRTIVKRLDFELDVIIKMKFPGYFLIVSDFIKWAKAQGHSGGAGPRLGCGLAGRLCR